MTTTIPAPIIEPDAGTATATATEWRQLSRWLWAGRRDGRPVGTIERGRRFVLTDAEGEALGAHRTFEDAAAAAEPPTTAPAPTAAGTAAPRAPLPTAAVAAALVLGGGFAMGAGALAVLATI